MLSAWSMEDLKFWSAPNRLEWEREMQNNPVIWFEIYEQDMERAKRFYESVFQVKLERLNAPDL